MGTTGERLRAERKRIGLNQAELAAIGGVSRKTLGFYEDNSRSPDAEFLKAVGGHGIDVGYVVMGFQSISIPKSEEVLIGKLRRASTIDQQTISRVIDAIVDDQRGVSVNPADNLPNEILLKQMFGTLLQAIRPGSSEEEAAEFMARNLEPALRAIEGEWEYRIDPTYQREEDVPHQRRA